MNNIEIQKNETQNVETKQKKQKEPKPERAKCQYIPKHGNPCNHYVTRGKKVNSTCYCSIHAHMIKKIARNNYNDVLEGKEDIVLGKTGRPRKHLHVKHFGLYNFETQQYDLFPTYKKLTGVTHMKEYKNDTGENIVKIFN